MQVNFIFNWLYHNSSQTGL